MSRNAIYPYDIERLPNSNLDSNGFRHENGGQYRRRELDKHSTQCNQLQKIGGRAN